MNHREHLLVLLLLVLMGAAVAATAGVRLLDLVHTISVGLGS